MSDSANDKDLMELISQEYAKIAQGAGSCCGSSSCGTSDPSAQALGYDPQDIKDLPEGVNMGLGCGNPIALASLEPGQVVLDLGSGAGIDVFIAAKKVGPSGRVIGVDMTADMVSKARAAVKVFNERTGLDNVEFRLGQIEYLPVPDCSIDVVISNCVINLSCDKPQVWREISRVLRPGGRVAVSDIALIRPLPEQIRCSLDALVGCIAGAASVEQIRQIVEAAGLVDVVFESRPGYIEAMVNASDCVSKKVLEGLPKGSSLSEYITSLYITASKPKDTLSDKTKELIAIGASVSANCHPCLVFHVHKAMGIGIDKASIQQAMEVGQMVRSGAASQMDRLVTGILTGKGDDHD